MFFFRLEPVDNTTVKEMIQTNETFKHIMFPTNENETPQLFHVNEKSEECTPDKSGQEIQMTTLKTERCENDTAPNAETKKLSESEELKLTDTSNKQSLNLSDSSSDVQTNFPNVPSIVLPEDI